MNIPFVNLERQISSIREELNEAINRVIDNRSFILGEEVSLFEKEFSELIGSKYMVCCSSGTSSLSLSLEGLGVKPKDEVIVQANTFFASAEAVCNVGAVPVFVDINKEDYTVNIDCIKKAISNKTKAIIGVHLYGVPFDIDSVLEISKENNLYFIEDTAQGHLATYNNKYVGSFSDAGTFSFFPGKNLGAFGDAGAILTNREDFANKLLKLRNHGRKEKYLHDEVAYNHRMDGIQAAILRVKLKYLKKWTKRRKEIAKLYNEAFRANNIKTIETKQNVESSYHLYVIEVDEPKKLQEHLKKSNISTGIHYPVSLDAQTAFNEKNSRKTDCKVSNRVSKRILSLPICGSMSLEEANYVIEKVLDFG